jgi:hypothetical protein
MSRRKPTEPVTAITVHPEVWTDALRQAGGDASRIEIISETSVVVHNRSDWRSAAKPAAAKPPVPPAPASAPAEQPTPQVQPGPKVQAPSIPAASFVPPEIKSDS